MRAGFYINMVFHEYFLYACFGSSRLRWGIEKGDAIRNVTSAVCFLELLINISNHWGIKVIHTVQSLMGQTRNRQRHLATSDAQRRA